MGWYTLKFHTDREQFQVTHDNVKKINKLKPYTRYVFMVCVSNYYGTIEGIEPVVSEAKIYRTAPGGKHNLLIIFFNERYSRYSWHSSPRFSEYLYFHSTTVGVETQKNSCRDFSQKLNIIYCFPMQKYNQKSSPEFQTMRSSEYRLTLHLDYSSFTGQKSLGQTGYAKCSIFKLVTA